MPEGFEAKLATLERASERSLTSQLVDVFTEAIASGELPPGSKLPPTRTLAAQAGINQLTASRSSAERSSRCSSSSASAPALAG